MIELDKIYNEDCLIGLSKLADKSVDLVLTDIPYNAVNRESGGLRSFDKGDADIGNFDVEELTKTLCRKSKGSVYMFCEFGQVSGIYNAMVSEDMSTRLLVWQKTNPSPINGEYIWLSGIEVCVFGKHKGGVFNEFCQNTVFKYPITQSLIHPTQKPVEMFRRFVIASTNKGDIVLDPFMGSGTTAIACINEKRHFIGFELNKDFYDKACKRIRDEQSQLTLDLF